MIPFPPMKPKRRRKTPAYPKVTELVYVAAGMLPKGCGSIFAFPVVGANGRRPSRSRARKPHDCLTLASPLTDDPETLCCPWCSRLVDAGEASRLVALRAARVEGRP